MSDNPFSNIDVSKAKVPLQEKKEGKIIRKKAGRPKRPNMQSYLIKMDKGLHKQISDFAADSEMNKSAVISMAIKDFLKRDSIAGRDDETTCSNCGSSDSGFEGVYILKKFRKEEGDM